MKSRLIKTAMAIGLLGNSALAFAASHDCCGDLLGCCLQMLGCC